MPELNDGMTKAERAAQLQGFLTACPSYEGMPQIFLDGHAGDVNYLNTEKQEIKRSAFGKHLEGRVAYCWYQLYTWQKNIIDYWAATDPKVAKQRKVQEIKAMLAKLEAEIAEEAADG